MCHSRFQSVLGVFLAAQSQIMELLLSAFPVLERVFRNSPHVQRYAIGPLENSFLWRVLRLNSMRLNLKHSTCSISHYQILGEARHSFSGAAT